MSTDKILRANPKFNLLEVIGADGDFLLLVGNMGEEDIPHYFVANAKYGVIEGSCSTYKETADMMAYVTGKDKPVLARSKPVDLFN